MSVKTALTTVALLAALMVNKETATAQATAVKANKPVAASGVDQRNMITYKGVKQDVSKMAEHYGLKPGQAKFSVTDDGLIKMDVEAVFTSGKKNVFTTLASSLQNAQSANFSSETYAQYSSTGELENSTTSTDGQSAIMSVNVGGKMVAAPRNVSDLEGGTLYTNFAINSNPGLPKGQTFAMQPAGFLMKSEGGSMTTSSAVATTTATKVMKLEN